MVRISQKSSQNDIRQIFDAHLIAEKQPKKAKIVKASIQFTYDKDFSQISEVADTTDIL